MTAVTLMFPTIQALKQFSEATSGKYVEININKLTLTCTCSRDEIELAVHKFGAKLRESGLVE
jgi:hypothetical protein